MLPPKTMLSALITIGRNAIIFGNSFIDLTNLANFSSLIILGLFGILVKNRPDEIPWPQTDFDWTIFSNSMIGLVLGAMGFGVFAYLFSKFVPKVKFLSGLELAPAMPMQKGEMKASIAAEPETAQLQINVGDAGEALSLLRPAGRARFGGAVVDVVAEGAYIKKGAKVKIVSIHGNRVVVREI